MPCLFFFMHDILWAHHVFSGGKKVSAQTLLLLVELRNKMGLAGSFMENDLVTQALQIAKSKTGLLSRMRQTARQEQRKEVELKAPLFKEAGYNVTAAQLLGPRGGLPKSKEDLSRLAIAYGIRPEGKTADQLKTLIRPCVATGARLREEPLEAPADTGDPSGTASCSSATDLSAIEAAVRRGIEAVAGQAPPEFVRAATREALHHMHTEETKTRKRTEPYANENEEMEDASWTPLDQQK